MSSSTAIDTLSFILLMCTLAVPLPFSLEMEALSVAGSKTRPATRFCCCCCQL